MASQLSLERLSQQPRLPGAGIVARCRHRELGVSLSKATLKCSSLEVDQKKISDSRFSPATGLLVNHLGEAPRSDCETDSVMRAEREEQQPYSSSLWD